MSDHTYFKIDFVLEGGPKAGLSMLDVANTLSSHWPEWSTGFRVVGVTGIEVLSLYPKGICEPSGSKEPRSLL